MEVLEDRASWEAEFLAVWMPHFEQTGETNWKLYNKPKNETPISGKGVSLRDARVALITSAGSYIAGEQTPYDAANLLGDYSVRLYSKNTALDALAYAHDHYDHTNVDADPQVLVPLRHLEALQDEGIIGEFAPTVISFMGYQPDVRRVLDETAPAILKALQDQHAEAALLVPS